MNDVSNAELALLSLLAEKSMHAYEIEKIIEERNIRNWTELGFSSIYRLLTNMEKKKWLSAKLTPSEGRGPARKVYALTEKGKELWRSSVLNILEKPDIQYSNFLLALDNLFSLPVDVAITALKKNMAFQQQMQKEFTRLIQNHPKKDDFYISAFFDYMINHFKCEIRWLNNFISKYESHFLGKIAIN